MGRISCIAACAVRDLDIGRGFELGSGGDVYYEHCILYHWRSSPVGAGMHYVWLQFKVLHDLFKIGPILFEAGFAAVMLYAITVLVKRRVES